MILFPAPSPLPYLVVVLQIGFEQCTLITDSVDPKKGFGRPLYLFKK